MATARQNVIRRTHTLCTEEQPREGVIQPPQDVVVGVDNVKYN